MSTTKLKIELSKQIRNLERNGFAYLGPVLRKALFNEDKINWKEVEEEFIKQNPELLSIK